MAVVPDVSAILGQALDDEDATFAEAVIAAIARDVAIVPPLFCGTACAPTIDLVYTCISQPWMRPRDRRAQSHVPQWQQ